MEDVETSAVSALVVLVAIVAMAAFEEALVSVAFEVFVAVVAFVDVVAFVGAEVALVMEYHCGIGWRPRNTLHLVLAPVPEMAFARSLLQPWLPSFQWHQRAYELEGV